MNEKQIKAASEEVKKKAQALYYKLRELSLSHEMAIAAVVQCVLDESFHLRMEKLEKDFKQTAITYPLMKKRGRPRKK